MSCEVFICGFCGKGQSDSRAMILGPNSNICNHCVGVCQEIIDLSKKPVVDDLMCVVSIDEDGTVNIDVYEKGCDEEGIKPIWSASGDNYSVFSKANIAFPGIKFIEE